MVAADLSDAALGIARRMGADGTVNPGRGEALPQDVEVAIEASGAPRALGGVIAAVRRGKAPFSITARMDPAITAAISRCVFRYPIPAVSAMVGPTLNGQAAVSASSPSSSVAPRRSTRPSV